MLHVGLFEGIGGFGLAAKWAGIETIATCEINEFGNKVTAHHFPEAYKHGDVRTLTKEILDEKFIPRYGAGWTDRTILTAGFPCQPFSVAGRRAGTDDDRYLWPETLRVISEVKPAWVIGENVAGILSMAQPVGVAEVASESDVFGEVHYSETQRYEFVADRICRDLESIGYSVIPFVIPACAVGAPHRRDRVWFVANRTGSGAKGVQCEWENRTDESWDAADTTSKRRGELRDESTPKRAQGSHELPTGEYSISNWKQFPTVSPICSRDDGVSLGLAGISFPRWRREAITALGNAVVPQIPQLIMSLIDKIEQQ